MDKEEKRRLANERRLKAVQQWQKNKTQQRVVRHFPAKLEPNFQTQNKLTLFESDEEDVVSENDFNVGPQYKGAHGHQFLELNAEMQGDFKIDDRFATVDDLEEKSDICEEGNTQWSKDKVSENSKLETDSQVEKSKNMEILESVLGCPVKEKYSDEKKKRKHKIMRFDPDDENSSKYLKTADKAAKVPSIKIGNKVENNHSQAEGLPICTERYVDVDSNLKEILSTSSTTFSFSTKFETSEDLQDFQDTFVKCQETEKPIESNDNFKNFEKTPYIERNQFTERRNYSFFISEGHPYLKQGIEFWVSNYTEKESEWNAKKEKAMTLFKNKRKVAKRRNASEAKPQRRTNSTK